MSATHRSPRSSAVDLPTLVITAVASATAAYVTSEIWAPGTLASAAITPVIVALVKEALAKPADVVTRAVPVRGVVRSADAAGEPRPHPVAPAAAPGDRSAGQYEERVPQQGEIPGRSRPVTGRPWRMAVVTGLLGFVIAAVIITVPEFVAGQSASGGDRKTTFFGGDERKSDDEPSRTETTTEPTETQALPPASTVTVPPVQTTTVPQPQTTTIPPAQTTTVPPEDEPAPVPPPPPPP